MKVRVSHLSVVCLILAERSRRTGPGSMVGKPVAEVVVVHVDDILLSNPGGRLRLRRWRKSKQTCLHTHWGCSEIEKVRRKPVVPIRTDNNFKMLTFQICKKKKTLKDDCDLTQHVTNQISDVDLAQYRCMAKNITT